MARPGLYANIAAKKARIKAGSGEKMRTKLCPRGKSAAKRKFKVYPSAYANAYASRICAGKIKDPSGVKRKDFKGRKPAMGGGMMQRTMYGMGGSTCKLATKGKGNAYGKNS